METNQLSPNNTLSFSLDGATGPQVVAPTRFARALKQSRMARGWTQAEMARKLSLSKRAVVSWETAERVPGIGIVVLLLDVFISEGELPLHHELVTAYVADDLEHQAHRKDPESAFVRRVQRVLERVARLSPRNTSTRSAAPRIAEEKVPYTPHETQELPQQQTDTLEPLFALIEQLRLHPDLIPVANDFVRELAPDK